MEYNFIKADKGDIDDICNVVDNAIYKMDSEGIFQWDEEYPTRNDFEDDINNGELYLIKIGKEIAAMGAVHSSRTNFYAGKNWCGKDSVSAEIHRLCVNVCYQNKGIGKLFLAETENMLRKAGFEAIRLDAFPDNKYAIKMYEGTGYICIGDIQLRKGRFVLMEKSIV